MLIPRGYPHQQNKNNNNKIKINTISAGQQWAYPHHGHETSTCGIEYPSTKCYYLKPTLQVAGTNVGIDAGTTCPNSANPKA